MCFFLASFTPPNPPHHTSIISGLHWCFLNYCRDENHLFSGDCSVRCRMSAEIPSVFVVLHLGRAGGESGWSNEVLLASFLQSLVAEDGLGFRRLFLLATRPHFMASMLVCLAPPSVVGSSLFKCLRVFHSCSAVTRCIFRVGRVRSLYQVKY